MLERPDAGPLIGLFLLASVMLVVYAFNMWQALQDYLEDVRNDAGRDGTTFRAFLMAMLLWLGLFTIWLGRLSGAFFLEDPFLRDLVRFFSAVLYGALIVLGFALIFSWVKHK